MKRPMTVDWDAMGELWREQRPKTLLPVGLARRVRAHTRLMWLTAAIEIGLFVGLAVLSGWYLGDTPTTARVAVLVLVWILNIGIAAFSVWNRRGKWRADAETMEAYLDLIQRRARAKLRVARFVRVAAALQAAAVVALVWVDSTRGGPAAAARVLAAAAVAAVVAVGYGVWSVWYEGRARAELIEAEGARRLMEEGESDM